MSSRDRPWSRNSLGTNVYRQSRHSVDIEDQFVMCDERIVVHLFSQAHIKNVVKCWEEENNEYCLDVTGDSIGCRAHTGCIPLEFSKCFGNKRRCNSRRANPEGVHTDYDSLIVSASIVSASCQEHGSKQATGRRYPVSFQVPPSVRRQKHLTEANISTVHNLVEPKAFVRMGYNSGRHRLRTSARFGPRMTKYKVELRCPFCERFYLKLNLLLYCRAI